jgi:hypothetical protein
MAPEAAYQIFRSPKMPFHKESVRTGATTHPRLPIAGLNRDGKKKRRSFPWLRLRPDAAAVPLDDPMADCETNARTRVLAPMQPLKHVEYALRICGRKAQSVIPNREGPLTIAPFG